MRKVAGLLALMTVIAVAIDLMPLASGTPWGEVQFTALGEVWFRVHPDSYQLLEPAISRHLSPLIWDYAALPLVTAPVALVLGILTVIAWLLRGRGEGDTRTRRRRQDFRRR